MLKNWRHVDFENEKLEMTIRLRSMPYPIFWLEWLLNSFPPGTKRDYLALYSLLMNNFTKFDQISITSRKYSKLYRNKNLETTLSCKS